MSLRKLMIPTAMALASVASAQAVEFRGAVRIDESTGSYYLHCTDWPVKVSATFLDDWFGKPLLLEAYNRGTAIHPQLDIVKAGLTQQYLRLGKMQIGSPAKAIVAAPLGSYVSMCFDLPSNVVWRPLTLPGWMLGPDPCGSVGGFVHDTGMVNGEFQFNYLMPYNDKLVGMTFVSQAWVFNTDGLSFTNLDCQTVNSQ